VNLREGTRRLALLLGVAGAILGGFASYLELQSIREQRASHNRFERLAASDVVKKEQDLWPLRLRYTPEMATEAFLKLPESQQRDVFSQLNQEEESDLVAKLKCEPPPPNSPAIATVVGNLLEVPSHPGYKLVVQDDPYACSAESSDPPPSTVNESGIKTVHWTKKLDVESIETDDGQTIYPTSAPPAWMYFLIALFPVLGFIIPWGAVRAIGWVGTGFFQPAK